MYDELIEELRLESQNMHYGKDDCELFAKAADAIEKLNEKIDWWKEMFFSEMSSAKKWIMIEIRPMDDEERRYYSEQYGFNLTDDEAVIYCCQLPEHGQEVLVCNKYGQIWIDTFDDDPDYKMGFETNGDMDGLVAWMPLPEPPKEET